MDLTPKTGCHSGNLSYVFFAAYAEARFSQQNKESRPETVQDHSERQSLRSQSSRRHLLSSKSAKRKRQLGKMANVDKTDVARIKANLPFG